MLIPEKISGKHVALPLLIALPIVYLILVPLTSFGAWLLVQVSAPNAVYTNPETGLFVALMAIWFPIWPTPMLAAFLSWRYIVVKLERNL